MAVFESGFDSLLVVFSEICRKQVDNIFLENLLGFHENRFSVWRGFEATGRCLKPSTADWPGGVRLIRRSTVSVFLIFSYIYAIFRLLFLQ